MYTGAVILTDNLHLAYSQDQLLSLERFLSNKSPRKRKALRFNQLMQKTNSLKKSQPRCPLLYLVSRKSAFIMHKVQPLTSLSPTALRFISIPLVAITASKAILTSNRKDRTRRINSTRAIWPQLPILFTSPRKSHSTASTKSSRQSRASLTMILRAKLPPTSKWIQAESAFNNPFFQYVQVRNKSEKYLTKVTSKSHWRIPWKQARENNL